jgi:surfactin synthase thioesterase subunit
VTGATAAAGVWVRRHRVKPDARVRLVCLPHAGGTATSFARWSTLFPPTVELLAVQYPGRQERHHEPHVEDIMRMAPPIADELAAGDDLPIALFGHSMGAVVAFEVARRLEAGGVRPVWLFPSGRPAPGPHHGDIGHRDDESLLAEMREFNATDERLLGDEEIRALILRTMRSDFKAMDTYRYEPGAPLSCPVTALTGDADTRVSHADAAAWERHTTGAFEVRTFPGGHFYLRENLTALIHLIGLRLRSSAAPRNTSSVPMPTRQGESA